jgi:hypothetical protein
VMLVDYSWMIRDNAIQLVDYKSVSGVRTSMR